MQELLKTISLSDDSHSRSLNHVVPFTQRKHLQSLMLQGFN